MQAFTEVLRALQINGSVFLEADFTAPWCVSSKIGPEDCGPYGPVPLSLISFHYIIAGQLKLAVAGQPPVNLQGGDIVILPRNDFHILGSDLSIMPINADKLIESHAAGDLAQIRYGGGGERCRIICGYLGTPNRTEPVLSLLPTVMKVAVNEGALGPWVESSFRLAAEEMSHGVVQSNETLGRLAELLFVESVRHYLNSLPEEDSAWLVRAADSRLTAALGLMHRSPEHPWTTDELAREVGMSRSSFAARFTESLEETPMRYLTRLRLAKACRLLQQPGAVIARISRQVGYESEAAFNRAFRRELGLPPAEWRRAHTAAD
ncbi:MAG TPA: AraC family transcriptional regulator [Xanthomonadales bacterium]|nr:AraC family transcriptional regulator [Xanthomonadales bacterium]